MIRLMCGHCTKILDSLDADQFHCVATSPPYYRLRSYLPKDHPLKRYEIGSEKTPYEYIAKIVAVFQGVRRVLHPSGLLFLNLGDSYGGGNNTHVGDHLGWDGFTRPKYIGKTDPGQLLNMPHRVAEALRADGWIWRQTIVWAKRSPMPELMR